MDVRVKRTAEAHDGLVAWRLLLEAGLCEEQASLAVRSLRRAHDGVYLTGHARITDHQRRLAATLTAPDSVLSHVSAGAEWGARPWAGSYEVVTRPGSGGPRRFGDLVVCRSTCLDGDVTRRDGIPITTPARTIIDLAAHLAVRERDKAVREAIRLGVMTAADLSATIARHPHRRGTRGLAELASRLGRLPLHRTRSDAEARALCVLDAAGLAPPHVNCRFEGEEADLAWPALRRIVEIDGPQFHQDPSEDARKEAAWRAGGWTVARVPSGAVFDEPERLIALVNAERPSSGPQDPGDGRST